MSPLTGAKIARIRSLAWVSYRARLLWENLFRPENRVLGPAALREVEHSGLKEKPLLLFTSFERVWIRAAGQVNQFAK
jgi:hypothetical protein